MQYQIITSVVVLEKNSGIAKRQLLWDLIFLLTLYNYRRFALQKFKEITTHKYGKGRMGVAAVPKQLGTNRGQFFFKLLQLS